MASGFMMLGGFVCLLLFSVIAPDALAQEGKDLFQKQCASCHTIGGGDGVGPDLKDVRSKRSADWLVRMITEPDKLTAEKDPTQVALVKKYGMEMPKLGVSRDDAQKIVTFLQGGKAAPTPTPTPTPAPTPAAAPAAAPAATAAPAGAPAEAKQEAVKPAREQIATGRALFTGKQRMAKGGGPCVACHPIRYLGVYGGGVAADLTDFYGKMGESGVRGVLGSLSFPVMKQAYAEHPLTEPETAALAAFFQDASAKNRGETNPYPVTGLLFFGCFLVLALAYKRRIG
jgi:mono/diheme cytochrome c family protein